MYRTMTAEEVNLAMRIIGLRRQSFTAPRNFWKSRFHADFPTIMRLDVKGHVDKVGDGWILTPQGIAQLRQQIGEFRFSKPKNK